MSEIIRQPPVIEPEEIKVFRGKSAMYPYTRNLYLDDIHLVYDKVSAICERVELSAAGYSLIPFELREQVKEERLASVTIQGYQPRFLFSSTRGSGIRIQTYDDSKPSEALFRDIDAAASGWISKPLLLFHLATTSRFGILWLILMIVLPITVALFGGWAFLTLAEGIGSESADGWAGAVFVLVFVGCMFFTSTSLAPRLVGSVIWYYRREAPRSPLHWPTILINAFLLLIVAVVSWYLGYRWR